MNSDVPDTQAAASAPPKIGLVLTGGGARAAYQVGVLRAVAHMLPRGAPNPFQIVSGTSAGAFNAAAIAADADNFRRGVRLLINVWKNFHAGQVYRSDVRGIAASGARWLTAMMLGGLGRANPASLLDNAPLAQLLARRLDLTGIQRSIDNGRLHALAITASGYTSGLSITFYQSAKLLPGWQRARRVGVPAMVGVPHLMASAAMPFIFPAVHIDHEYFGDGSMRQIAPLSPALHLGADRLIVVTLARINVRPREQPPNDSYPSLAQIAGHALTSIFFDALEADLEQLERINQTLAQIPEPLRNRTGIPLRRVDYLVLSPSVELEPIAAAHLHALPWPVRFFLRGVGAMRRSGSNLASYLLFERPYCRALIRLGYADTMARREQVLALLGLASAGNAGGAGSATESGRPSPMSAH